MKLQLAGILIAATLIISSCEPSEAPSQMEGTANVQFKLIDYPADYDAVLIDVVGLKYKLDTTTENDTEEYEDDGEYEGEDDAEENEDDDESTSDSRIFHSGDDDDDDDYEDDNSTWVAVALEPMVYDLLKLNNGTQALLADVDIPAGRLKGVRVMLGNNNRIVVDGDTIDLKVPSGTESGIKIKVDALLEEAKDYEVIVDFDAAKSVRKTGSGKYILKPVIRVCIKATSESEVFGSISGVVFPADLNTVVYAVDNEEDSVSAIPEENGAYLIEMLNVGDYFVVAIPDEASGHEPITVAPVNVMADQITELDTIKFE